MAAAARRLAAAGGGVVEVEGCGEEERAAFALGHVTRGYATRLAARLAAPAIADRIRCTAWISAPAAAPSSWFAAMAVVWSFRCCGGSEAAMQSSAVPTGLLVAIGLISLLS